MKDKITSFLAYDGRIAITAMDGRRSKKGT